MGYIYFMWFTVLFLLFVLLPIDRSYFKIFNKVPTPPTSKPSSKEGTSVGPGINPSTDHAYHGHPLQLNYYSDESDEQLLRSNSRRRDRSEAAAAAE